MRRIIYFLFISLSVTGLMKADARAQQTPRVVWQSILNQDVYDNGFMAFGNHDIAFAPEQPGPVTLFIKTPDGKQIAQFGFYDDRYIATESVFARQKIENLSEMTFKPGIYGLQYAVGGQAATQFVFKVEPHEVSDDPFNPSKTFKFIGPWQQYAYLTFPSVRNFSAGGDIEALQLHFWAGSQDAPSSLKKRNLFGWIMKDGKLVAHTKRTQGYLRNRWLEEDKLMFYLPHEPGKEVNAIAFDRRDMAAEDGQYMIFLRRVEDETLIRAFEVVVSNGEMQALPETALDYEKGHLIVVPRVQPRGGSNYKFEPAFWIKRPSAPAKSGR